MLARRITRPLEELTAGRPGHRRRPLRPPPGHPLRGRAADAGGGLQPHERPPQAERGAAGGVEQEAGRRQRGAEGARSRQVRPAGQRQPRAAHAADGHQGLHRLHAGAASWAPSRDKQEKGLLVVQRNLERLSRSINALLDFSRMDLGRIALNIQPFQLPALVDQILLHAALGAGEEGALAVGLRRRHAAARHRRPREDLAGDREPGHQRRSSSPPREGASSCPPGGWPAAARPTAELRVADTGIGIPADQVGRIFSRFHQVDGFEHAPLRRRGPGPGHREEHPGGPRLAHRRGERSGSRHRVPLHAAPAGEARGRRPRGATRARTRNGWP